MNLKSTRNQVLEVLYFLWQAVQKYNFAKSQDNPHKNIYFQAKSGTYSCTFTNQGLSGMLPYGRVRVYSVKCIGHEFNLVEGENTSSTIRKHPWKSLVCASAGTSPAFDLKIYIFVWIILWLCKMVLLNSLPQKVQHF